MIQSAYTDVLEFASALLPVQLPRCTQRGRTYAPLYKFVFLTCPAFPENEISGKIACTPLFSLSDWPQPLVNAVICC